MTLLSKYPYLEYLCFQELMHGRKKLSTYKPSFKQNKYLTWFLFYCLIGYISVPTALCK